jgi:hypothetical protein
MRIVIDHDYCLKALIKAAFKALIHNVQSNMGRTVICFKELSA